MGPSRTFRRLFRPTNIPAAIAALVAVVCGGLADHQNSQLSDERSRAEVLSQVNLIRAKLEGDINGDIQLVRGLVSDISTEPNITQTRFAELSASLLQNRPRIRNIVAAPDLVVSMEYPLAGNEAAIGLDYRKNDQQREAALRTRDSGDVVMTGPVDLVQGGRGLHRPAALSVDGPDERPAFLGHGLRGHRPRQALSRRRPLRQRSADRRRHLGRDGQGQDARSFFGDARVSTTIR